jgi:antitoxin ParD1/3/4
MNSVSTSFWHILNEKDPQNRPITGYINFCYHATNPVNLFEDAVNISLTPELEKLIEERVKSGLYTSASEVVREGLRLLQERDQLKQIKLDELRRQIQIGIDASNRGEVVSEEEAMQRLKARHDRAVAKKGQKK